MGRGQALAALVLVLACVGCGGKAAAPKPSGCVRIFFNGRNEGVTTPAQIRAVRERLDSMDDKFVSLRFVPKAEALARMKRRHPRLVADMPYNPFPDAFAVTAASVDDGGAIVDALTPKPPGVHVVKYSRKTPRC